MENRKQLLGVLEEKIGKKFSEPNLLEQIFVHRSFLNEHPKFELSSNERLEFLGDAVLEMIVTEYLYRNFSQDEGQLTSFRSALVKGKNLAKIAKKLGLDQLILLSRGEEKNQGRNNELILANTFEALIGGIYLALGFTQVQEFIFKEVVEDLKIILEKELYVDAKSQLQEIYQASENLTPVYKILKATGPDHAKKFVVGVYAKKEKLAEGSDSSKQKAQSVAAQNALKKIFKKKC